MLVRGPTLVHENELQDHVWSFADCFTSELPDIQSVESRQDGSRWNEKYNAMPIGEFKWFV